MEGTKRKIIAEIESRVKILYKGFILLVIFICARLIYVQFFSAGTARNAERLRSALVVCDSLKAHRGAILARDGRPLATSIFRKSVFFDFGSEALDDKEQFAEDADSLAKLLAAYFKDKTYKQYRDKIVEERNRCFRLTNRREILDTASWSGLHKWWASLLGLEMPKREICDTVRQHSHTRLFRDLDYNEWQTVKEYPIICKSFGVLCNEDYDSRVYSHNDLALRTIGRIGIKRPYGIEEAYREVLQGVDGFEWKQCIAPRVYTRVEGMEYRAPIDGLDVVTTLDVDVQDVADKALRKQLQEEAALWGTSIVIECATGDVLAMVNLSRNSKGEFVENINHALGSRLEPGSTFKLAALLALVGDCGLPTSTVYDSGSGRMVLVGETKVKVQDSHNIGGRIDMMTAFAQSANVYFTKAIYDAYKDNPQRYVDFLRSLHLDRPMGLQSLGEVSPILPAPGDKNWYRHTTLVNMGYGYGLELAPIQTLTLYNAVANNGRMVAPRLVTGIMRGKEVVEEFPTQTLVEHICDEKTLATVRECLEEVALTGTAKAYFGERATSFRVGAKTGTAKVAQGNIKYSDGYYLGSMVTLFPADKPRYTIMTAIFKKRGGGTTVYGAGLAGPVQKRIATFLYNRATNWAGALVGGDKHYPVQMKGGDIAKIRRVASRVSPKTASTDRSGWGKVDVGEDATVQITTIDENQPTMPDVVGMGLADAIFLLENRGLRVSFKGSGRVVRQSIAPGVAVEFGDRAEIELN